MRFPDPPSSLWLDISGPYTAEAPLRMTAAVAIRAYLQVEDWAYERKLPQD